MPTRDKDFSGVLACVVGVESICCTRKRGPHDGLKQGKGERDAETVRGKGQSGNDHGLSESDAAVLPFTHYPLNIALYPFFPQQVPHGSAFLHNYYKQTVGSGLRSKPEMYL